MTESWEEKTERLEREYQARIDRLREELDCGQDGPCAKFPGCNRHWEERNRELVKRVAELEASVETNKHWFAHAWNCRDRIQVLERLTDHLQSQLEAKDKRVAELEELGHETMSWSEKVDTETYWQTGLRELEIQNAALTKRVAELEEIAAGRAQLIDDQRETIESLQSQLAWTPVSKRLPTEPGWYLFTSREEACDEGPLLFRFTGISWLLQSGIDDVDGARVEESWITESVLALESFRRIELPKDGES